MNDLANSSKEFSASLLGLRWIIWIFFLVIGVFVWWSHWAVIDQVTRAQGSVIASSRTQVIQSSDGGTISEMLVGEGDVVNAGQPLFRFDRTRAEAGFREAQARVAALSSTVTRLESEVLNITLNFHAEALAYPEFVANQRLLYKRRQDALNEEIEAIRGMLKLAEVELNITMPLVATGDVSRIDLLHLQRQIADLKAKITNIRNAYFRDAQAELNKTQEELASVRQTMEQRRSQLTQTEIKAPMRGVVKDIRITTIGGVVRAGEDVMQLVPLDDDLVIEGRIKPSDIAWLQVGAPVSIKIDTYDYTIYGGLNGELTYISPDTLTEGIRQSEQPYFRVLARAKSKFFAKRPNDKLVIQPGMSATLEIKTGSRTVWEYLTKPITKTMSESLGEK